MKLTLALLFLSVVFALYMANNRVVEFADTIPARYLPLSIIREHNFDLDEFRFLHEKEALLYPIQYRSGHFLSFPPVGVAILATPFYLLPAWFGMGSESPHLQQVAKVAAAGIAALSALFILLTLAPVVPIGTALLVAGLYAFGTTTFGVNSQALWPIGGAQLLLAVGIYLLRRGLTDAHYTSYAAFPMAWAVICRPSMVLISLIVALYVWRWQRQQFLRFVLWASPAVVFLLFYNSIYLGDPFLPPGYVSPGRHILARPENFNTPIWKGFIGQLASPSVGFLVYSPVFLFSIIGMYRQGRRRDLLAPYFIAAMLVVMLLNSKLNMWWGGVVYGPRYVAEIAPILAYFLAFGMPCVNTAWKKLLFVALAIWSVYSNGLVAFVFDGSWDRQASLWSWSHSPIVYYSRRTLDFLRSLGPALVRDIRSLPDSRLHSGLAADLQGAVLPRQIFTHSYIDVTVQAQNTGNVVWRRETNDMVGSVRLGWRWLRLGESPMLDGEGRGPRLTSDVWPGRRATIASRIWAPAEPGSYELELGMVSEAVGWFGVDGGPLLRMRIEVIGESLCNWGGALAMMADPTEPPLHLQWVSDRETAGPHDALSLRLNISNPGPARVFYIAIVLRRPSGAFAVLDLGQQTFVSLCPGWLERTYPMLLDHGYRAVGLPILSLLPWNMPPGHYRLYFLSLRPKDSTMRVAAITAVDFERLP